MTLSCQKRTQMQNLSWKAGDDESNLYKIYDIQTAPRATEIIYGDARIEYLQQTLSHQVVENTFVKKVYDSSMQLTAADAVYIDPMSLADRKLTPLVPNTQKLVEKIKKEVAPLRVRRYNSRSLFKLQKNLLKNFQMLEYELSDGTLWRATFNVHKKLLSKERLGSNFSDTQTSIYLKGPKLGPLTDVTIKGLDAHPALINTNIMVDSEGANKIISLAPILKFDPKDERFDQIQVFYYLDFVINWMKNNLDIRFPERLQAIVNVGYPDKTNTAFYFQNKIRLGRGDEVHYSMMAADASIIYHEAFHALIDGVAHLPFDNEGGSLNEAFADFFTCVVLNSPLLGESSFLEAPYRRTIESSIKLNDKTGGLYHDSQIISSLLWEIKQKLGNDKSLKIAMQTLLQLNPVSQFSDFNSQLLIAANQFSTAEDFEIISNLLRKRGFHTEKPN